MKMKSFCSAVMVAALGMSMISAAGAAQDKKGPNRGKPAAATPTATAVESLAAADALVHYGDANKDPLALITAAKIMRDVGTSESTAKRTSGAAGDAKQAQKQASVDAILARAKTLAGGRQDLVALADDVAKAGTRGAVGGPGTMRTVVRSRSVDNFRVTFRGGEPARVYARGDGDSDLDLFVYDENGNRVCADTDSNDEMLCAFTPSWTGSFTIRVRNLGVANEYVIRHN